MFIEVSVRGPKGSLPTGRVDRAPRRLYMMGEQRVQFNTEPDSTRSADVDDGNEAQRNRPETPGERKLSQAALRALAEAEARRASQPAPAAGPVEIGGPAGPEPTRYGDWEVKGRASDF
jgi:hypothetical protein